MSKFADECDVAQVHKCTLTLSIWHVFAVLGVHRLRVSLSVKKQPFSQFARNSGPTAIPFVPFFAGFELQTHISVFAYQAPSWRNLPGDPRQILRDGPMPHGQVLPGARTCKCT